MSWNGKSDIFVRNIYFQENFLNQEGVWSQDAVTNFILKPSSHNGPHILIKYQTREDLPLKTKLFHSTLRRGGQNERKGRFLFWPEWTAMKDYLISLFSPQNENETIRRQDAETFENVTLELGLFVDRFLFESLSATFAQNTDRQVVNVVTAMMNAVQILFDDEALGHKVRLVIKRIQVLKEEPENLKGTLDIEQLLSNFCQVSFDFLGLLYFVSLITYHIFKNPFLPQFKSLGFSVAKYREY